MMTATDRDRVIEMAESFIGTPYHHAARVKGAGVDCATFLCMVYEGAGITGPIALPYYPMDWAMHRSEEKYLSELMKHCLPTETPQRGDIVMFKFGRCASHGAIVVDWPVVIHSHRPFGVVKSDVTTSSLQSRVVGFYSPQRAG